MLQKSPSGALFNTIAPFYLCMVLYVVAFLWLSAFMISQLLIMTLGLIRQGSAATLHS